MIDYISFIQSTLEDKGCFDEFSEADYYELMVRRNCNIDLSPIRQYIAYEVMNNHHYDVLIKRPRDGWEREKLMIKLTTVVLGIKQL